LKVLSALSLSFADAAVERAFRDQEEARVLPQLRRYAWFALLAGPIAALAPSPVDLREMNAALGAVMSCCALLGLGLTRATWARGKVLELAAGFSVLIGLFYVGAALVLPVSFGEASHVLVSAHLVATATALRLRFRLALPTCASVAAVFAAAVLSRTDLPAGNPAQQVFAVCVFAGLGLFANH